MIEGDWSSDVCSSDLFDNHDDRIEHVFHSRPSQFRKKDYLQDEFVRCFPLQFPFGVAGFPKETAMEEFHRKTKRHWKRPTENEILKCFLKRRKPEFHKPEFNLMVNNLLMRHQVFANSRLQCNLKSSDCTFMSEKYGEMTSASLSNAVNKARADIRSNGNPTNADKFLSSISAVCRSLPYSNEASKFARNDYYSFLIRFGLPALFVTINPDDQRSFWITVALKIPSPNSNLDEPNVDDVDESDLIILQKKRIQSRTTFPGLAAEEYKAIVETFVSELLGWDNKSSKATHQGIFGWTEAWTCATEEQGRKTLHGHFLVWIKGWNELLHKAMNRKLPAKKAKDVQRQVKEFVEHCSSATIFHHFDQGEVFEDTSPFMHEDCKSTRNQRNIKVAAVSQDQLAEMRRCDLCKKHDGHIATCLACGSKLKINQMIQNCLNGCENSNKLKFDRSKRRLEATVFEMQKDFEWFEGPPRKRARRLFLSNVYSNIHNIRHSDRCFKKSPICYAKLPASENKATILTYAQNATIWADWNGSQHEKTIFETTLKRGIADAYTNVHNPILSMTFLCNNNILAAMTGAAVLYVTGYNFKSTQKEEQMAFEKMARVLIDRIKNQEVSRIFDRNNVLCN